MFQMLCQTIFIYAPLIIVSEPMYCNPVFISPIEMETAKGSV